MKIQTKTFVFALAAMLLGSGTTLIAVAAVPDGPGRGGIDSGVPGPDIPGFERLPDGSYIPSTPGRPDTSGPRVVPGGRAPQSGPGTQNRNLSAREYEEQERRYEEERDRNDAIQESLIGIDSADACKLLPAANTVSARGECTMGKSCIVQQRRARTEAQWRDSIGNPTPRENGEEYRPFCR